MRAARILASCVATAVIAAGPAQATGANTPAKRHICYTYEDARASGRYPDGLLHHRMGSGAPGFEEASVAGRRGKGGSKTQGALIIGGGAAVGAVGGTLIGGPRDKEIAECEDSRNTYQQCIDDKQADCCKLIRRKDCRKQLGCN